jgi:hypothetical protein
VAGRLHVRRLAGKEDIVTQATDRRLEMVRAANRRSRPRHAILILCDRVEDLQPRVDVLIAAGNLAEADRPRCVACDEDTLAAMTHEDIVFMLEINETAEDRRRGAAEAAEENRRALAELIAEADKRKSDFVDRL